MAYGDIAYKSHNTSTDPALIDITVRLDPSKWSKRKKNIITRCIMSGILHAGYKTVSLVADIMEANDIPYRTRRMWSYGSNSLQIEEKTIKPERLNDLKAIITAQLKIRRASDDYSLTYDERQFLSDTNGHSFWSTMIPFPKNMNLEEWLREDTESDTKAKEALCEMIWNNETITAIYQP